MAEFTLTPRQKEALEVCSGPANEVMLEGGSGSAKTFLNVRNIVIRALKAPGSRHGIFRFRFNHVVSSIGRETMPDVLSKAFPGLDVKLNASDWIYTFPNGSEIYLGGLDDKERAEKILGKGLATAFLNECSQISWDSRNMVVTRMRQKVADMVAGRDLPVRIFYDQNPPSKGHWTYKLFHKKLDPESGKPIANPDNYAFFKMNPQDNEANLSSAYLGTLQNMSPRYRKRFWEGEYTDDNPSALFSDADIDRWRVMDGIKPEMVRIVVAVDPSGAGDENNADNDAIGIVAAGLGTDGNAYVLEDNTVKAGPATWGGMANSTYDRLMASQIVGEKNYGGEMVRFTIQATAEKMGMRMPPFAFVQATRGKTVRAEPIAALYALGKVRHVGYHRELEEELAGFSTHGYIGENSPNRADALVWAITALFPGIVAEQPEPITHNLSTGYNSTLGFA